MTTPLTQRPTDEPSRVRATGASLRADGARGIGCVFPRVVDTRPITRPVAA